MKQEGMAGASVPLPNLKTRKVVDGEMVLLLLQMAEGRKLFGKLEKATFKSWLRRTKHVGEFMRFGFREW